MPMLNCHVTDDTLARLQQEATDLDRTVEDLAECALEESVRTVRLRQSDPEREARNRERCKRDGVVNIVNGTCTTCERSAAECDCLPF